MIGLQFFNQIEMVKTNITQAIEDGENLDHKKELTQRILRTVQRCLEQEVKWPKSNGFWAHRYVERIQQLKELKTLLQQLNQKQEPKKRFWSKLNPLSLSRKIQKLEKHIENRLDVLYYALKSEHPIGLRYSYSFKQIQLNYENIINLGCFFTQNHIPLIGKEVFHFFAHSASFPKLNETIKKELTGNSSFYSHMNFLNVLKNIPLFLLPKEEQGQLQRLKQAITQSTHIAYKYFIFLNILLQGKFENQEEYWQTLLKTSPILAKVEQKKNRGENPLLLSLDEADRYYRFTSCTNSVTLWKAPPKWVLINDLYFTVIKHIQELKQEGDYTCIPLGNLSHSIIATIIKDKTTFTFKIFNTAKWSKRYPWHKQTPKKGLASYLKPFAIKKLTYEQISHYRLYEAFFNAQLNPNSSIVDLYEAAEYFLIRQGKGKKITRDEKWHPVQKEGICSHSCIVAFSNSVISSLLNRTIIHYMAERSSHKLEHILKNILNPNQIQGDRDHYQQLNLLLQVARSYI